jgi:hypothetical protein
MNLERTSLAIVAVIAVAGSAVGVLAAQGHPAHVIMNGEITARVYLPDAKAGFYRSTRFDWSGAIASLQFKGHEYYGDWFAKITDIYDFGYDEATNDVISAQFTAMVGPAEEFGVIGYNEAKPGGLFVKPGIGALRRADETPYNHSKPYEIANGGKWEVERRSDSIRFVHTLKEPSIDFGYVYTKVIALTSGKPQLTIAHVFKNIGAVSIRTNVYNHNFTTIDQQPPGPDYEIAFPFQVQRAQRGGGGPAPAAEAARGATPGGRGPAAAQGAASGQGGPGGGRGLNPPNGSQCGRPEMQALAAAQGNRLVYSKALEGRECYQAGFIGFGATAAHHDIRIENKKVGAGVRITGDRPLFRLGYWSIRSVLAPEPYVEIAVEPGQEFTWTWTYDYFVTK